MQHDKLDLHVLSLKEGCLSNGAPCIWLCQNCRRLKAWLTLAESTLRLSTSDDTKSESRRPDESTTCIVYSPLQCE
jgi:hypothetical protein